MYLCALYFEIGSFLIIFHCDIGLLGVCQNRGSVRAAQGALASTTATAAKTSVLNRIAVFSIFVAFILSC